MLVLPAKSHVRVLAAGLIAVLLGGCQSTKSVLPWMKDKPAAVPAPETDVLRPQAPALPPEPPEPPNVEVPDPAVIAGWTSQRMRRLIGKPSLERTESQARFWNYESEKCVLYVILNQDAAGILKVSHIDSLWHETDIDLGGEETKACLEVVATEFAQKTGS